MAVNVPLDWVFEWNFFGPLVTVTLCGRLLFHFQTTFVPALTVSLLGEKELSLTLTDFVAARAGMAAAARTRTAARGRTRRFMPRTLSEDGGLREGAPHVLERLDDLALGGVHAGGVEQGRHEV